MDAMQSKYLPAQIEFVFCNREPGEHEGSDRFMELVARHNVPLICLSSRNFRRSLGRDPDWRAKYDAEVASRLAEFQPDVCVLAGFMHIWGPAMSHRYPFLNVHPAAPNGPKGTWQEVIWQLIAQGATESGVMVHIATEELDAGPVIAYCMFHLRGTEFDGLWAEVKGKSIDDLKAGPGEEQLLFKLIRQHMVLRERPLLIEALKSLAEGHISVREGVVIGAQGLPVAGQDLTAVIESKLQHTRA
jgi:folate-dependent phosphoribosylglycinamide formyltransferase PurN